MNMKYLAILVGACLALMTGCVVETSTGGVGGAGGTGGTGTAGSGTAGSGTAGSGTAGTGGTTTSTGGTGGTGGSATCVSCAEAVTPGANPNDLDPCEGTSADLYAALVECT